MQDFFDPQCVTMLISMGYNHYSWLYQAISCTESPSTPQFNLVIVVVSVQWEEAKEIAITRYPVSSYSHGKIWGDMGSQLELLRASQPYDRDTNLGMCQNL